MTLQLRFLMWYLGTFWKWYTTCMCLPVRAHFLWQKNHCYSDKKRNKSPQKLIITFPRKRCWKSYGHHHLSLKTVILKFLTLICTGVYFFIRTQNIFILITIYIDNITNLLILENLSFIYPQTHKVTHIYTHPYILIFFPYLLWII